MPSLSKKSRLSLRILALLMIFNADAILFGLIYFDVTIPSRAFIIALCISIPEIPVWYWALNNLFGEYTGGTLKGYWMERFETITNPKSVYAKLTLTFIEVCGFFALFFISSEPLPFGRTFTILFCVVTNTPAGLLPIIIGNVIHLYGAMIILGLTFG